MNQTKFIEKTIMFNGQETVIPHYSLESAYDSLYDHFSLMMHHYGRINDTQLAQSYSKAISELQENYNNCKSVVDYAYFRFEAIVDRTQYFIMPHCD